ncbi:ABC tran domain containing protein, partial [Asbolus verrucosus]
FGNNYGYFVIFKKLDVPRSPIFTHMAASLKGLKTIRACKTEKILVSEFDEDQNRNTSANYMIISLQISLAFWTDIISVIYNTAIIFSFFFFKNEIDVTEEMVIESWPTQGEIEFQSVSLKYNENDPCVLNKISFKAKSGEKIGIVSRTGAGKSSIISVLYHMFPYEGKILIDDVDIKSIPLQKLRSSISIIPQEPVLFYGTTRKNLDPFDEYSDLEIWSVLEEVELKPLIVNLPSCLNYEILEGGSNFNVGQLNSCV